MPIDPICATGRRCADCGCLPDSGRGGKCNCSDPGCQCSGSNTTTACSECNGWGWIESDRCTCGTGPSGHYGMHEPHCGLEPCPRSCPFIPPAPSCGCPCGCPAPGKRDNDGTPGWCDPCRMNIHPVTAKTED